jgi:hypothetical protein
LLRKSIVDVRLRASPAAGMKRCIQNMCQRDTSQKSKQIQLIMDFAPHQVD